MSDSEATAPVDDHTRWPRNKLDEEFAAIRAENIQLKIILATLVQRTGPCQ